MSMTPSIALTMCALLSGDYIDHYADPNDIGLMKIPREGETRVLVIPVFVDDQPFARGSEVAFQGEIDTFFDSSDAPEEPFTFTSYYETMSLGRYRPVVTVAPPVRFATCPPIGPYADCAIPRGAGISQGAPLSDVVATIDDALLFIDEIFRCATSGPGTGLSCTDGGGVTLSDFDNHGVVAGTPDGFIDGVLIVSNARFPGIALPIKDLSGNFLLAAAGPHPEFEYDGVTVGAVGISGFTAPPQRTTWVSTHEFGHLLGMADLYNEVGSTTDMPYTHMGGWGYDAPAPLVDPYSRLALGFAHAVQVNGDDTFTITPSDLSGTVLKVGSGDEFFVVELRRRVEDVLDDDLGLEAGVVVERVYMAQQPSPDRGEYLQTLADCVNCTPFDSFLSIEQADGAFDLENNRGRDDDEDMFIDGDAIVPSADTEPRSLDHQVFSTNRLDGTPTGITIRVVSVTSTEATIEIESERVDDPCAEIERFCGELECTTTPQGHGECGRVVVPPPDELIPPDCVCGASSSSSVPDALLAIAVVGMIAWRRRR